MPRLDDLPADQRAVLQLLLRQGKSYGDLAGLLRISDDAVRDRAHQALEGLAGAGGPALDADRREEIGDYLLGQQSATQRAGTRAYLEDSAPGRAWAHAAADELEPLAGDDFPYIPADPAETTVAAPATADVPRGAGDSSGHDASKPTSRLGGVLLLVGLVIAVAGVAFLLIHGANDDKDSSSSKPDAAATTSTAAATDTTSTTGTSTTPINVLQQVNLTPPGGGSKPLGVAQVVAQGSKQALAIEAQSLPASTPSSFYAVWLYTSPSKSLRLGFAPSVKSDGNLQAITTAPAQLKNYQQLVITAESVKDPAKPGTIVLAGKLKN